MPHLCGPGRDRYLEIVLSPMAKACDEPSKKLELRRRTLPVMDDQDLTDVAGGGGTAAARTPTPFTASAPNSEQGSLPERAPLRVSDRADVR